jgi:hypothetical protein
VYGVQVAVQSHKASTSGLHSQGMDDCERRDWSSHSTFRVRRFVFHGWNAKGRAKGQKARLKMLEMTC